ncbi:MAG: UDP-N-acetylmuramoyl-tripeptide--D-alanyl-D-alanine ligase [Clostridia bacterium]|nr:UDP-N-acetylmuramoyl-tripeptide--D-alanyl-D-alanine ligase [Clostridia bacterium]
MIYKTENMTAGEIATAVGGELVCGSSSDVICGISTDSRTTDNTSLFIPLKGEKFDAHSFLNEVCKNGIGGYLCETDFVPKEPCFGIRVKDTGKALLDLASHYRKKFDIKVVALTGSVGKTTTKEMLASVISQKYNVHATSGNFNNNIGVPLTLFGLCSKHEVAVVEMGMSNFGEIEVLTRCALPDIAIITNIGTSHIEFLGSQEGILRAKSEIFEGLASDGRAVLNGDDAYLVTLKEKLNLTELNFVGIKNNDCEYIAYDVVSSEDGCDFLCKGQKYHINLPGIHNVYNALCAIAVGEMLDMTYNQISSGLASYVSSGIRQNIISVNDYKVINDCYNASPQSDIAALGVLAAVSAKRRIAVFGDIGELGLMGEKLHRSVGEAFEKSDCDVLITCGELSKYMAQEVVSKEKYCFDDTKSVIDFLKTFVKKDDAILVKASRFMKFETISEALINQ